MTTDERIAAIERRERADKPLSADDAAYLLRRLREVEQERDMAVDIAEQMGQALDHAASYLLTGDTINAMSLAKGLRAALAAHDEATR